MAACGGLLFGSQAGTRSPHKGALLKALEYCLIKMKDELRLKMEAG